MGNWDEWYYDIYEEVRAKGWAERFSAMTKLRSEQTAVLCMRSIWKECIQELRNE